MGIFGGTKDEKIKFLEEERQKLWGRLTNMEHKVSFLEGEIEKRSGESEKEAKQHSRKAAEFRNKTEERFNTSVEFLDKIESELEQIRKQKDDINELREKVEKDRLDVGEAKSNMDDLELEYTSKLNTINSNIETVSGILSKYPDLDKTLEEIEELSDGVESNFEKSGVTLTSINKRKKDIDDLHRKIFGYHPEDDEEERVEGLKDELDNSYNELKNEIDKSFESVEGLNNNYKLRYEEFESNFKDKYAKINSDIESLLPNALTAGLSSAFSKKKEEEVESATSSQQNFKTGIAALLGISLIPVIVSIYFIYESVSLDEVILTRLPRIVLAILPMYIPLIWFTFSANKKINLSKRLIEEYSHKEVLSRTYEGLSKQIASIEDEEQSEELRFRLLSMFLQVSSENPGKLISNYEASDHPLMEALEQSYKFQMTIDKLEGIPGLSKVAAILEKKSKQKISEKESAIKRSLEKVTDELDED